MMVHAEPKPIATLTNAHNAFPMREATSGRPGDESSSYARERSGHVGKDAAPRRAPRKLAPVVFALGIAMLAIVGASFVLGVDAGASTTLPIAVRSGR